MIRAAELHLVCLVETLSLKLDQKSLKRRSVCSCCSVQLARSSERCGFFFSNCTRLLTLHMRS